MAALRAVTSRGEVVLARLNEDAIVGGSLRGCAFLLSCCATTDALVRFLPRWTRLAAWSIWCLRTANPRRPGAPMADVVIGGGFFGCRLALALRERGERVTVVEREADLLLRASANNQARVHGGYHYPRSILTGLRSRVNYPRFVAEFGSCIDRSFRHYYAVARRQSHVTARQFELFCQRIGARLSHA